MLAGPVDSEQESERLFLERASAKSLCLLTTVNWNEHSVSARHRMSLKDVNYCHVVTEGSWTVFPAKFQPQMAYEITIGRSSFIVELVDSICRDSMVHRNAVYH